MYLAIVAGEFINVDSENRMQRHSRFCGKMFLRGFGLSGTLSVIHDLQAPAHQDCAHEGRRHNHPSSVSRSHSPWRYCCAVGIALI
jgi:hypothetical protein